MSNDIQFLNPTEIGALKLLLEDKLLSQILSEREPDWRGYINGLAKVTFEIRSDGMENINWVYRDIICVAAYAVTINENKVHERLNYMKLGSKKELRTIDRIQSLQIQFRRIIFDLAEKTMFLFFAQVVHKMRSLPNGDQRKTEERTNEKK